MRFLVVIFIFSLFSSSAEFSNHLSFQGFTGLINTPNAQVLKNGEATLHYNNQFDNHLRDYNNHFSYDFEDNYILGIGFLSSLELIGRLADAKGYIRDISANIKYQIPLTYSWLPNIAIGIQDVGGDRNYYNNSYIVMDQAFGNIRLSGGYGVSGDTVAPAPMESYFKHSDRMDGFFGGVEYQVIPWLSLLGEYTREEQFAGIQWHLPKKWSGALKLDALVTRNLTSDEAAIALNLTIPLNKRVDSKLVHAPLSKKLYCEEVESKRFTQLPQAIGTSIFSQEGIDNSRNLSDRLKILEQKLEKIGFENISIGLIANQKLYIACENSIFDRNDLDAIGYIFGSIIDSKLEYSSYVITLLKNRLETITLMGDMQILKNYMIDPSDYHRIALKNNLHFTQDFNEEQVNYFIKNANSSFFRPRLEIFPGLIAGVGTDVGVVDYSLSMYTNLYTTLYDGLMISMEYETMISKSDDFKDGKVFDRMYERYMDSRLATAMIHQTFHLNNLLNTVSIGRFDRDYNGVLNLTNLVSDSGRHSLGLRLGSFQNKDKYLDDDKEVYLGTYRYFYTPLELFTEFTYGKFWYNDQGGMFRIKRFFNDTAIAFYYQDTTREKYIGFTVTLPLTPRKLHPSSKFGQLKGIRDFTTGLRSSVFRDDGTNLIDPYGGITPVSDFEIGSYYLNSYRLTPEYIQKNLERIRSSYILFK